MSNLKFQNIISALHSIGVPYVACLTAGEVYEMLRAERENFENWQRCGCAGEMKYMTRDVELFFEPKNILKDFKSLVVCFIPYGNAEKNEIRRSNADGSHVQLCSLRIARASDASPSLCGKIARYAMFADYHKIIKNALTEVMQNILLDCKIATQNDVDGGVSDDVDGNDVGNNEIAYRIFADALPFPEKVAGRALGFVGKNTLLRVDGFGSFGFLAEIFLNVELEQNSLDEQNLLSRRADELDFQCGSCTRCMNACPTNALIDGKYLNAQKCISYLTIEKKTAWTIDEMKSVGDCLFGCDKCQEVCPHNNNELQGCTIPEIYSSCKLTANVGAHGVRPPRQTSRECKQGQTRGSARTISFAGEQNSSSNNLFSNHKILPQFVDLKEILHLKNDAEFKKKFGGTSFERIGRERLIRNACAVAANCGYAELFKDVECVAADENNSEFLREQAAMSLRNIYN